MFTTKHDGQDLGRDPRLVHQLASFFEREGRRALSERGFFAVALPGGSVARTLFPRLAESRFDWSRAEFFWSDERAVPAADLESNYRVARSLWLDSAKSPPSESIGWRPTLRIRSGLRRPMTPGSFEFSERRRGST